MRTANLTRNEMALIDGLCTAIAEAAFVIKSQAKREGDISQRWVKIHSALADLMADAKALDSELCK